LASEHAKVLLLRVKIQDTICLPSATYPVPNFRTEAFWRGLGARNQSEGVST
jgi:hypothetical protein